MKLLKRLGVIVALVAVCLFAYLFLGGIDAERPAFPDLGLGVETVKEDDNWYLALVAATNLVSLGEDESSLVGSACTGGRNWWQIAGFDTESQARAKIDSLIARHGELFKRLGANVNRQGWQHPPREAWEPAPVGMPGCEDLTLVRCAAVRLLDIKIQRELDQGEFMFAFADLHVMYSLGLAAMRGAENLMACEIAHGQLRRTMRRFMAHVTQLDGEQLAELQSLLDAQAKEAVSACANAYAREVGTAEARFDWLYRRGGAEQMMSNLLDALASVSDRLDDKLDKGAERVSRAAFKTPNFSRFSLHFNRSLARYYEEAVKTHANLQRGKYDLPIRALRSRPPNRMWNLPIYPNWIGRAMFASMMEQGLHMCLRVAAGLFVVSADRVVVAANRYRLAVGEYPKDLQALVPEYLEAVPDDPFGDGKLGFNAAQGTVHSVAENGGFDGVIPTGGARALHYTDDRGTRRWYTPYIRRLDGKPIVE